MGIGDGLEFCVICLPKWLNGPRVSPLVKVRFSAFGGRSRESAICLVSIYPLSSSINNIYSYNLEAVEQKSDE